MDGRDRRPRGDWQKLLGGYVAQVDWPGASFWREISSANPDALVLLSTRDPEAWYRSASNTIFQVGSQSAPWGRDEWFATTMHKMWAERFSDDLENPTAMMDALRAPQRCKYAQAFPQAGCWSGLVRWLGADLRAARRRCPERGIPRRQQHQGNARGVGHATADASWGADVRLRPEQVVQLCEASCGRLAAERSVWALMVVSPEPAVKGCGALG